MFAWFPVNHGRPPGVIWVTQDVGGKQWTPRAGPVSAIYFEPNSRDSFCTQK